MPQEKNSKEIFVREFCTMIFRAMLVDEIVTLKDIFTNLLCIKVHSDEHC
jgi:hypothetical protein